MLKKLEHQLNVITGFAGTTLQQTLVHKENMLA
jgi:hypothetical protein